MNENLKASKDRSSFDKGPNARPSSSRPDKLNASPKLQLSTSVQYLKGVGPKLGVLLQSRGIRTVNDLLSTFPRAFEDRRAARSIATLKEGDIVGLQAQILRVSSFNIGARGARKIYDIAVKDSTGVIHCKFFRVPYKGYFSRFQAGQMIRVIGKVILYRGKLEFHHPELKESSELDEVQDDLIPIYTEIEGLGTGKILRMIRSALAELPSLGPEKFPKKVIEKYGLLAREEAIRKIHYPDPHLADDYNASLSPAHRRLIFEEFFWLEIFLAAKRAGLKKEQGIQIQTVSTTAVEKLLPFQLTGAQRRALNEVAQDMGEMHPMHRLVQGDVGCGKTLVAFLSAYQVIRSGHQACLMAPTEILAEQHLKNAEKLFSSLGIRVAMLSSRAKTAERKVIHDGLLDGSIQFIIGTHALIESDVLFKDLALVVIDEQHRFGVEQKLKLKSKGREPHILVMTATPIPRTLAMTVYGDLDVSIIDEMPPGRQPIKTRVVGEAKRGQMLSFVREQLEKGRQAYLVYPLVEESEKIDLKDAMSEAEKLREIFSQYKVGLLHGKMSGDEKDQIMNKFRRGEIHVLVSTTVIEVGVDVPNANIMVVEHAERFGLSQLHQLRGRVGRGAHASYCIMMLGYAVGEDARTHVQFMEKSNDGFKVAEFDLEIRGPGEFLGTRQSGLPGFQMANLIRDVEILLKAREAAFEILREDPQLRLVEHTLLKAELLRAHGPVQLASIA